MQATAKSHGLEGNEMDIAPVTHQFLFVGSTDTSTTCELLNHYSQSKKVNDFTEAVKLLSEETGFIPALIIIDGPLDYKELISFKIWQANWKKNSYIPTVYNELALNSEELNKLYKQQLVDDIINLKKNYGILPDKARFISGMALKKDNAKRVEPHQHKTHPLMRMFDIVVSATAITLLSPLFLMIGACVKLGSKGPAIYSSPRAGQGFRIFKFYKFRTMVADADKKVAELSAQNQYSSEVKGPNFFKVKDDPRITKCGKFLRNSSLDELPQLFNVLLGDMSIVGNRPLPLYEAVSLTTDEWAERFMAPAGITGLWQVSKRGSEEMSTAERVSLDIDYARTRSLGGDFKIMLKTPTALLQKTNV